ncbi:MAG: EAL domain-containing protein [Thiomicrorhabdus sp.]|nr:EAL domain-containing protein [Thiomicrorhabdus sp.]
MYTLKVDDKELYSVFQPIYSFSNQACIGAEVLVRGKSLVTKKAINVENCLTTPEGLSRSNFTRKLNKMHLQNWQKRKSDQSWIFLNLDFQYFDSLNDLCIAGLLDELNLKGHQIVVEVVESEIYDDELFQNLILSLRQNGCLIALDDFGAGHSNVNRIWKAQPDIVKLDRAVLIEATKSMRGQSILRNLTRLIQQAGSIALLEGVETREQALLAMDVGMDLVQGFYFAKPDRGFDYFQEGEQSLVSITHLYPQYQKERKFVDKLQKKGYEALFDGLTGIDSANQLEQAMLTLSELTFVKRFYILDQDGFQISEEYPLQKRGHSTVSDNILKKGKGLCWKNRRYFIKAMQNANQVYVSKPYRSLIDVELCLTVSKEIELIDGTKLIACYDVYYRDKSISSVQISV